MEEEKEITLRSEDILEFLRGIKKYERIVAPLLVITVLALAFYSRTLDIPNLHGYLVSMDDPYIFLRYTNYIIDLGYLPANDTLRYYPNGFDTTKEMLLPSYFAAFLYKTLDAISPGIDRMLAYYMYTPICLTLGLIAFFFLLYELFKDWKLSLFATVLLAFSNAILFRTISGFLEKEPLSLAPIFLSFLFFMKAWKQENSMKKTILYSILAGFSTGILVHIWGGFMFVTTTISLFLLFMNLLGRIDSRELLIAIIWASIFTFFIGFTTDRYGGITHLPKVLQFQIVAFSCLVLLLSFLYRKVISNRTRFRVFHRIHEGIEATIFSAIIVFILALILLTPTHVLSLFNSLWTRILYPTGVTRMALSISENQPTYFSDISNRFSLVIPFIGALPILFILFYLGSIFMAYKLFPSRRASAYFSVMFATLISVFLFKRLSPQPSRLSLALSNLHNPAVLVALVSIFLVMLIALIQKFKIKECNESYLLLLIFFSLALTGATGSARLVFVLGLASPPVMAIFLFRFEEILKEILKFFNLQTRQKVVHWWRVCLFVIAIGLSIALMKGCFETVSAYRVNMEEWQKASDWIKANTTNDSVFVHWWDYGYWIQYSANRATVGDPGNFYWLRNYDVGRYLMSGYSKEDFLYVLNKYGRPDYLYIVHEDVGKFYQMARIGERDLYFQIFSPAPMNINLYQQIYSRITRDYPWTSDYSIKDMLIFQGYSGLAQDFEVEGRKFYDNETALFYIIAFFKNGTPQEVFGLIYNRFYDQQIYPLEGICLPEVGCFPVSNETMCFHRKMTQPPAPHEKIVENLSDGWVVEVCMNATIPGRIPGYVFFSRQARDCMEPTPIFIQHRAMNTLFARLYLFDLDVPGFEKVYENMPLIACVARNPYGGYYQILSPTIDIWKIDYESLERN